MRLATWNINGVRARLDYILLWLEAFEPDVVGLQELKVTNDQFPLIELEAAGYQIAMHGQKSWNGVAVLSKSKADVLQVGLEGREDDGARLLSVQVEGLRFTTVYCPNGKRVEHADFPEKLAWFDALRNWVEQTHEPDEPAILCGDFNIVPAPLDSWNEAKLGGSIFHTDDERRRFQSLLDLGLFDLFRERHPDRPGFTWWDYRGGAMHKKQGLRIDVLMGTAPIQDRVIDVVQLRDWRKKKEGLTPSDHAPVYVDLD